MNLDLSARVSRYALPCTSWGRTLYAELRLMRVAENVTSADLGTSLAYLPDQRNLGAALVLGIPYPSSSGVSSYCSHTVQTHCA